MANSDSHASGDASTNTETGAAKLEVEADVKDKQIDKKAQAKDEKKRVKSLGQLVEEKYLKEIKLSVDEHAVSATFACVGSIPFTLKDADMYLYETVHSLGLTCVLAPVITLDRYYDNETEHVLKGKFTGLNEGFSIDGFAFDEYGERCWGTEMPEGKVTWINGSRSKRGKKTPGSKKQEQKHKDLKEVQMAYLTYRNEPGIDIHYSRAAMLIRVPPFRERGISKEEPKSVWTDIRDNYDEDDYYDDEDDYSYSEEESVESEQHAPEAEPEHGDGDVDMNKEYMARGIAFMYFTLLAE